MDNNNREKARANARLRTVAEMNAMPGREMEEKRTERGKFYALGENLYQMVLSEEAVHYRDKRTGRWMEIDNTLESRTGRNGGARLVNRANDKLRVALSPVDAEWTVELQNDEGHALAWRVDAGAETAAVKAEKPRAQPVARTGNKRAESVPLRAEAALALATSEAVYEEILPRTDLRCRIEGTTLKEDIVFKAREAARPVSFVMETKGVMLALLPDRSMEARDEDGNVSFVFPAPTMEDTAGETGEVGVELFAVGDGRWHLVYAPDEAYLARAVYPVTLDPTVKTTDHTATALKKNLVKSAAAGTVFQDVASALVEDGQMGSVKSVGYYRFEQAALPPIDSSYYVTDATLAITSSNRANTLYLHEVLEDWDPATLTYMNKPAFEPLCADALVSGGVATLNITNMVRRWYEGTNHGFAVQVKCESETGTVNTTVSNPTLTISYVSQAGLAQHLTYESHSTGRAGTAHVGLFNGNLVVEHADTSTSGARMPVSVGHYYNACYHDLDLYKAGKGWRHSLQVTLHREMFAGDTNPYYVLTDGTGTRHHFKLRSGLVYDDLSGLYLTLTVSGTKATIEDKGNSQMEFDLPTENANGLDGKYKLIKTLKNAQGDALTVTGSEDGRVLSATDAIGRVTAFEYAEDGMLAAIYAPGHEDTGVHFHYDGDGHLVKIVHEDETEATYAYDETGRLDTLDNYSRKVSIGYQIAEPRRVSAVWVHHSTMQGNHREYAYGDGLTIVTDRTVEDGKKLVYHFNDYGNVISVNDMLGQASFTKYTGTVPLHRPEIVSKTQRAVPNLLKNHSFEEDGGWDLYCTAEMTTDAPRLGTRCLRFTNPEHGGFQYAAQDVRLTRGKTYTLSFHAKKTGNMELWVTSQHQNALGRTITVKSPPMEDDLTETYSRSSYTFTLPEDALTDTVRLSICAKGEYGEEAALWVDTAQLEAGDVANQYNLLRNTDFSRALTNGLPEDWVLNAANTGLDAVQPSQEDASKPENVSIHAMRLYGGAAKTAGLYQEMNISGKQNDVFVAGGWSKGYSLPRGTAKKKYNLRIAFKTGATFVDYADEIQFSEEWSGWQFACGPVIAPYDYTAIRFHIDYEKNLNHADFTSVFLYKEEFGWTYAYDSQGNIISVKDLTGKYKKATYDAQNNLTTYVPIGQADTVQYRMEYGATDAEKKRHLLRKTTSPLGMIQTHEYDSAGNRTLTKLMGSTGEAYVQSEAQYTADKNHAWAAFDDRGRMVIQQRDPKTDLLQYTGGDGGASVLYAYDERQRLVGAHIATTDQTARNQYEYDDETNDLIAVKHNTGTENGCDVVYNFAYDALGNRTETRVGDRLLAKTVYTETGDKLPLRQEFGNGDAIDLERDAYKRLRAIRVDEDTEARYVYSYDAGGNVAKVEDHHLGRTRLTDRDLSYRPVRFREREGDKNIYRQTVEYDACSRVVKRREAVGDTYTRYDTGYTYDIENRPTEIAHGDTVKSVYDYGKLDRVESVTLKRGTAEFKKNFTYQAGGYGGASTTATVEKIEQPGHAYQYTMRGGLAAERHNGVKTTYEYDGLGQLKRVNDEGRGTSTAYTYDQGGNILSKAEYPYAARGRKLGEATRTVAYAYGDDGWKDVLTAYDGVAIESDAIGNVVDDGTWRYTWRMGRQLLRMASPAEYIWYAYDADGLRVRKESESRGVTEYTLSDGRVAHQRRGTQEMHFWYGSRRNPVMATYNGKDYGYVYNRQGDVIAMVDVENGFAEVVTYAYDAWGKLLACTGPMAETLGRENPFRYRGYVYDEETGLYYLKSRYYNPEWGRFISADSVMGDAGTLMGHNLFAYCFNNPVKFIDSEGRYPTDDANYSPYNGPPKGYKGPTEYAQPKPVDDRPSSSVNYLPVEEDAPKSNGSSSGGTGIRTPQTTYAGESLTDNKNGWTDPNVPLGKTSPSAGGGSNSGGSRDVTVADSRLDGNTDTAPDIWAFAANQKKPSVKEWLSDKHTAEQIRKQHYERYHTGPRWEAAKDPHQGPGPIQLILEERDDGIQPRIVEVKHNVYQSTDHVLSWFYNSMQAQVYGYIIGDLCQAGIVVGDFVGEWLAWNPFQKDPHDTLVYVYTYTLDYAGVTIKEIHTYREPVGVSCDAHNDVAVTFFAPNGWTRLPRDRTYTK